MPQSSQKFMGGEEDRSDMLDGAVWTGEGIFGGLGGEVGAVKDRTPYVRRILMMGETRIKVSSCFISRGSDISVTNVHQRAADMLVSLPAHFFVGCSGPIHLL